MRDTSKNRQVMSLAVLVLGEVGDHADEDQEKDGDDDDGDDGLKEAAAAAEHYMVTS